MALNSLSKLIVAMLATSTTITAAPSMESRQGPTSSVQFINAVWSTGSFSTISGTSGNEIGHDSGFSLVDDDGNTIWSSSYPGDYAPCQEAGHTFTLSDGCFAVPFSFECTSTFAGDPQSCEVLDSGGNVLDSANGNTDTDFYGIGISTSGYCGVSFALGENVHCDPDSTGFTVS